MRNNLGLIHKNLCEWDAAVTHSRGALEIWSGMGRSPAAPDPLINLGIVHQKSGDWALAAERYAQAEQVFLQVGDPLRLAAVAIGLGNVARLQRRFADSETHLLDGARARARLRRGARGGAGARVPGRAGLRPRPPERRARALPRGARDRRAHGARGRPGGRARAPPRRGAAAPGRLDEAEPPASAPAAWRAGPTTVSSTPSRTASRGDRDGPAASAMTRMRGPGGPRPCCSSCRERLELGPHPARCRPRARRPARGAAAVLPRQRAVLDLSARTGSRSAEASCAHAVGAGADPAPARPASLLGRRHRAPSLVACSTANAAGRGARAPRRGHRPVGADHRRDRHRQGARRPHHPRAVAPRRRARSWRSTAARCAPTWRCRSCSATARAPSPARTPRASGWSRPPTAARCSWTRSASCRSTCR